MLVRHSHAAAIPEDDDAPDTLPSAPDAPKPQPQIDPAAADSAIWRVSWREQLVALLRKSPATPER